MKHARQLHVMLAWVALLALMLASLGSSYLPLGRWNLVIGLAIATLKSLIVLWLFMGLVRAPATLRMAAGLGFGALALLFFLSGVDFATRDVHPATMQQPRQLQVPPHRVGEASGLRESSSFLRRQDPDGSLPLKRLDPRIRVDDGCWAPRPPPAPAPAGCRSARTRWSG